LEIPSVGVSKDITKISEAATQGNYILEYTITLQNTGNVTMNNVSLEDDIQSQLNAVNNIMIGTATLTSFDGSNAAVPGSSDGAYDGTSANPEMLDLSGILEPGEFVTVLLEIEVDASEIDPISPETNTATGSGDYTLEDGSTGTATDDSEDGTDPTGNDDNDDGTEDTPTPLPLIPDISVSKNFGGFVLASSGIAGNVDVTFDLEVLNTGNTTLTQLALTDDLVSQFGPAFVRVLTVPTVSNGSVPATTLPSVNPAFIGTTPAIDMLLGTDGELKQGESYLVSIVVELDPNVPGAPDPLENQATGTATPVDENGDLVKDPITGLPYVSDNSDSGADPEDNNNGDPGDSSLFGAFSPPNFNDPTEIRIPQIAAVKNLVDYALPASGLPGHVDIIMEIGIMNTGNVALNNITLQDILDDPTNFGSFYNGLSTGQVTNPEIVSSTATADPLINSSFDGFSTGDPNIFDGTSGTLDVNQEIFVQFTVELDVSVPPIPDTLYNQANVSGSYTDPNSGETTVVNDDSDSGSDFESTNPNAPGDMGTSDDITPIPMLGSVCGTIWEDCNGDGVRNDPTSGMAGVQVDIYNEFDQFMGSALTNAQGFYELEYLIPGKYYIKVNKPGQYNATDFRQGINLSLDSDIDNSNGDCTSPLSTLTPGPCNPGSWDAGLYECIPIGELVWYDINENDVKDPFENGINGLPVELWKLEDNDWVLYAYSSKYRS